MLSIILAVCASIMSLLWWMTQRKVNSPPGPRSYPFVGNSLSIGFADFLGELKKLRKTYGDVFSLMIFNKQIVVVCGHKANKEILIKQGHAVSERSHSYFVDVDLQQKGIIGSSGKLWKEHRTFALTSFRNLGLGRGTFERQITEEVSWLLENIKNKNGKPFNMTKLMTVSTANVVCAIAFGNRYNHNDIQFQRFMEKIERYFIMGSQTSGFVGFFPWMRFLPGIRTWSNNYLSLLDEIFQFFKEKVAEHKADFNECNIRDYIDAYLAEQIKQNKDDMSTFTDDQLIQILMDLLKAGTETTSSAIQWACIFFIQNPEAQNKMRKEILEVVGDSRRPTLADKPSLPYCEAVVSEILRCGNVAPLTLTRNVTEDVHWGEYIIPKGSILMPCLESIQWDPEVFPNPRQFKPERFLTSDGKYTKGNDNTFPFGAGRRKCMGEGIARMEVYLFITSLIQTFKFIPEENGHIPKGEGTFGLTWIPKPVNIRAVPIQ